MIIYIYIYMYNYHLKNSAPVHQMKKMSMEVIEIWQMRVTKLYSTTSNKNHNTVIPNSNPADIFLSFHNSMSATASFQTFYVSKCYYFFFLSFSHSHRYHNNNTHTTKLTNGIDMWFSSTALCTKNFKIKDREIVPSLRNFDEQQTYFK